MEVPIVELSVPVLKLIIPPLYATKCKQISPLFGCCTTVHANLVPGPTFLYFTLCRKEGLVPIA